MAIASATGRAEAMRATSSRQRLVWACSASCLVRRSDISGRVRASRSALWSPGGPGWSARTAWRARSMSHVSVTVCGTGPGIAAGLRLRPNSRAPNSASSAGTRVIETASAISVVNASPGPNARKKPSSPTASAPVPAATIKPAVNTIGAVRCVAARTASSRVSPSRRRRRDSERKKTE